MTEPARSPYLSDRTLLIVTIVLVAALVVAAGIAWWVTYSPPMTPLRLPSVRAA